MAVPYTTAVSNQPFRNNGGTILKGGSGANTDFDSFTELSNAAAAKGYGTIPFAAVSPGSSGNIGTMLAKAGGTFAKRMSEGEFIALVMGTAINGVATSTLKIPAADYGFRKDVHYWPGYDRLNITSWNAVTGAATKGSAAGVKVNPSGINGVVGAYTDHATPPFLGDAIPGEFVFLTKIVPTQVDQAPRTSP